MQCRATVVVREGKNGHFFGDIYLNEHVLVAVSMMSVGQAALCITLLIGRAMKHPSNIPLSLFFFVSGIIAITPVIAKISPTFLVPYFALSLFAWLSISPILWLYISGLTSQTPWQLRKQDGLHFIPLVFALGVSLLMLNLSTAEEHAIFVEGQEINSGYPLVVVMSVFISILFWLVQSSVYAVKIVRRLLAYQRQLKQLFANNENRELAWVYWVLGVVGLAWLSMVVMILADMLGNVYLFGSILGVLLSLTLVWTFALWGLRQKPGFDGRYLSQLEIKATEEIRPIDSLSANDTDTSTIKESNHQATECINQKQNTQNKKYARSALGEAQSKRIAEKINLAMIEDELHLDPSISLHKLARHVAISPNYISQTLNETMDTNFFDFINKWRIETAKPKIIANEDSVLNIAYEVGFNARSSFYKVFKRETGKTPTEYRKLHAA